MVRRAQVCRPIQPELVVIGVDVAKASMLALATSGDGREAKPLMFVPDAVGFEGLLAYGEAAKQRLGAAGFVVAAEPTGHYGLPLVTWLVEAGVEVLQVQPLHTSRAKELYDGTRRKTDAKDARVIANLCRQGLARPYRLPKGAFAELRVLNRQREQLVERRGQVVNRLHRHEDVLFPELRRVFPKLEGRASLWVMRHVPTPAAVLEMGVEMLATELRRASRGQLGRQRAEELFAAAQRSVGIKAGMAAHRLAVTQLLDELVGVLAQLREVEARMASELAAVPYSKELLSIPKLGVITVATLLGELGDLRDYRVAQQLIKMAGLDLVEDSSGQRKGRRHISRRGRRYVRQVLFLAALRLGNGVLSDARLRLVEEGGKEPMVAAVANMCRLLRIIHALARDGVGFEPSRHRRAA